MDFNTIYNIILSTGLGVIVFFLKFFFDKLNSRASREELGKVERKIEKFDEKYASSSELNELKEKIEHADEKYASRSELNELKASINKIQDKIDYLKDNTVRSGDFLRYMTSIEAKIDELIKRG